jgi:hypothetical protein
MDSQTSAGVDNLFVFWISAAHGDETRRFWFDAPASTKGIRCPSFP